MPQVVLPGWFVYEDGRYYPYARRAPYEPPALIHYRELFAPRLEEEVTRVPDRPDPGPVPG